MDADTAGFAQAWDSFVLDVCRQIDKTYSNERQEPRRWDVWRKADGSQVSALDLHIDLIIRKLLAQYFPNAAVLSEEIGLLGPRTGSPQQIAIIDPVDGTDSLVKGLPWWWVSVGLRYANGQQSGLIYQPSTRLLHDSAHPKSRPLPAIVVGMSPDRLASGSTAELRKRLMAVGARLIEAPHAVEKIAAVIEGRAMATIYLPSQKSPTWHSWDLAAGVPLAKAHGLALRTLDGRELSLDEHRTTYASPWMCAVDDHAWQMVSDLL